MSEHVNVSSRCPGGIRVTSPGSQHVDLLALRSDCLSIQCRHPPQAHRERARVVASSVDAGGSSQILQVNHFQRFVIRLNCELFPIHIRVKTLTTEYDCQHISLDVGIATFTVAY